MRRPRVLFVDHTAALGGAELCLLDIVRTWRGPRRVLLFEDGPFAQALREQGVTPELLVAGSGLDKVRREARLVAAFQSVPALLGAARRLAHAARDCDVVYANSQKSFLVAAMACRWARRPLIWHLHDILTDEHFSRVNIRAAVLASRIGRPHLVANSTATRDAFLAAGGSCRSEHVVPNGVDLSRFATPEPHAGLRESLDVPAAAQLLGVFGRLAPWKGQHVAIEALTRLPGTHLLLVGDALFGEHDYRDQLRDLVRERDVADRVHFLGFRSDVAALMQACDVVVHCSTAPEPFGRVIVEAMAAGRPVVASDAGGAREIVRDGSTGLLVSPGRPTDLAAALRGLVAKPARAAQLAQAGQVDVRDRFSLAAVVDRLENVTDQVAGSVRQERRGRSLSPGTPERGATS